LHAEDPYKQEVLLSTLINKSENIATYSGYYINGYFVNNSPNFSISYLRVNNSAPTVKMNTLLTVVSNATTSDRQAVLNEVESLSNFKPKIVTQTEDFDENIQLVRFDFLDEDNRIRLSEWRDLQNGFKYKSAVYDFSGYLLQFTLYENLLIDQPNQNLEKWKKRKIISFDSFLSNHSDFSAGDFLSLKTSFWAKILNLGFN